MPTRTDFDAWADGLRNNHPEMFDPDHGRRRTARRKWHPIYARVYGIRPWEMGRLTWHEHDLMDQDLTEMRENGIGV